MKKTALVAALAVVMMFGIVATAQAATGSVVITATINSKLILTVPADHGFGAFAPDASDPAPYTADVTVRSNVDYTILRTNPTNTFPAGMLAVTAVGPMDGAANQVHANSNAAAKTYSQTWTLTVAPGGVWQDPGNYTSTYVYTTSPL